MKAYLFCFLSLGLHFPLLPVWAKTSLLSGRELRSRAEAELNGFAKAPNSEKSDKKQNPPGRISRLSPRMPEQPSDFTSISLQAPQELEAQTVLKSRLGMSLVQKKPTGFLSSSEQIRFNLNELAPRPHLELSLGVERRFWMPSVQTKLPSLDILGEIALGWSQKQSLLNFPTGLSAEAQLQLFSWKIGAGLGWPWAQDNWRSSLWLEVGEESWNLTSPRSLAQGSRRDPSRGIGFRLERSWETWSILAQLNAKEVLNPQSEQQLEWQMGVRRKW